VASLSQGRTAAAQCGLFTYKSVPVIFEPPCILLRLFHIKDYSGPLLSNPQTFYSSATVQLRPSLFWYVT